MTQYKIIDKYGNEKTVNADIVVYNSNNNHFEFYKSGMENIEYLIICKMVISIERIRSIEKQIVININCSNYSKKEYEELSEKFIKYMNEQKRLIKLD